MAIYLQGNLHEWGMPVLFMRASDARLIGEDLPTEEPPGADLTAVFGPPEARRRLRLGPEAIARFAAVVLPVLVAAALLALGLGLLGPARMEGQFNVALAETGVLGSDGQMHRSADGQRVTAWILGGLAAAEAQA